MRKLGNGHSIMFFAPIEVDRSIREVAQKSDANDVDIADILHWVMLETCADIQMRAPHWGQQGSDFRTRHLAWHQFSSSPTSISTLRTAWLQPEERTLEEMYAPCNAKQSTQSFDADILSKCEELGVMLTSERSMDEEQEREVVHEVERERQVERPPKVEPAAHVRLPHPDIRQFVRTGQIPVGSSAFIASLSSLENTTATFPEHEQWAQRVLVTCDFARTVSIMDKVDDYLRPVNWVVCSNIGCSPVMVVMSPHEVNTLLPVIRRSNAVHLSIYTPRTTKTMQACDDLRLYSVPSTPHLTPLKPLIYQLNLFAGQLYFSNYKMYLRTCIFLGLNGPDLGGKKLVVDSDGFIREENRPTVRASCSFKWSQLLPLKELFGMRRKGMGYRPTHLGKMLNGRILKEEDFLE
jgi:hypothetical protein